MEEEREQAVEIGEVLVGKYRVERRIGRGGMGVVVEATHLKLDERVAIKLLHPKLATKPEIVARFMREARAASKIKSPHVVRVLDVDLLPSGEPYMVLELLEGFTLSQLSRALGPLDPAAAAAYVVQACDALAEAHELGIIHRDLKPSNLFLCQDRSGAACVKVLDFGISKVGAALGGEEITNTDQLLGSPTYMSPEQLRSSRSVDARTDIWSLGVVLYQCLTRSSPFQAETMPQVLMRVLSDEPEPPRELRAELPEGLERVILRCMDKDPERRFETAGELAEALTPFALAGPVPWPDVTLSDSLPAASARSAVRAVAVEITGPSEDGDRSGPEFSAPPAAEISSTRDVVGVPGGAPDTQVGWGTTLGSLRTGSRRKWLLATLVALVGIAVVAVVIVPGLGGEDPAASDPAAAPSGPASAVDGTESAEPASDPPEAPDGAGVGAGGAGSTSSATASSEATAAPATAAPAAPRPPAAKPVTGRPSPGARPGDRVDPFGKSRQ